FGVVIAIFLTQDFLPPSLQIIFKNIIELLAAIPSVVYGLWGIFVLIPLIRPYCEWLYTKLSWIPFFSTSLAGPGMLPAALVLGIMILPTVAAISQDSLIAIPYKVKEAAYGMGTTRWQAIIKALFALSVDSISSDGSLEPRNVRNCSFPVFIHSAPSKVAAQVLCRDAVKPRHPRFKAAMVAVNILDVEDRVHFVDLALGRDHPIGNIEVVGKAPEGTTAINA